MTSDLHHLAAAYALDALDDQERIAFEAHYPRCEICSAEVHDYRETAAFLAGAEAADPPADMEARVMEAIGRVRQIPPIVPDRVVELADRRAARTRRASIGAAATAIVIAVVGFAVALRDSGVGSDIEAVFEAPDAVVTSLDGDGGTIQVIWSQERDQVALVGTGLANPGAGRTYALWFLLDEGVAPAGLFAPDRDGVVRAVIDVDDIDGGGFGVTVEPDGGSPQPTGPVLYAGTV